MLVLLLLMVSVGAGVLLRNVKALRHVGRTATWTVWLLIFVFGISLGSNDAIVNELAAFGFKALIVALAGVSGSVLAAWAIEHYVNKSRLR